MMKTILLSLLQTLEPLQIKQTGYSSGPASARLDRDRRLEGGPRVHQVSHLRVLTHQQRCAAQVSFSSHVPIVSVMNSSEISTTLQGRRSMLHRRSVTMMVSLLGHFQVRNILAVSVAAFQISLLSESPAGTVLLLAAC